MAAYKSIRALLRAIVVLEHLNHVRESSSNAIAIAVGLPKTTSYRILKSLMDCKLAYFSPSHNGFRLTPRIEELSPRVVSEPFVRRVIEPALNDLSLHVLWPCAFSVCEDGAMAIKARTHQVSPFSISTDLQLSRDILTSGAGLAYLAFLDPGKRSGLLDDLARNGNDGGPEQRAPTEEQLAAIRACGFALEPASGEGGQATLAVPLCKGPRVIGSLHVTWLPSPQDTAEVVIERVLPRLQQTRRHIEESLVSASS